LSLILEKYEIDRKDSLLESRFPWGETLNKNYVGSLAQLQLLRGATARLIESFSAKERDVAVLSIGSSGRLDGSPGYSDVDLLVVDDRATSPELEDSTRARIVEPLVKLNQGFIFDHRATIEKGDINTIETRDICYPIISSAKLADATEALPTQRRLQILLEGTPVYGEAQWLKACDAVVAHYRMQVDHPLLFPSDAFRKDFVKFADGMWEAIAQREVASSEPNNRKIAKAIFLRRVLSRIDALTVAMACYMQKSVRTTVDLLSYTSAPPFIKLGFWIGDRFGRWFAKQLEGDLRKEICERFSDSEEVPTAIRKVAEGHDLELSIRTAIIGALRDLDRLLEILYSPDVMHIIDSFGSDYASWANRSELKLLREAADQANHSVQTVAVLANVVFEIAGRENAIQYAFEGSRLQQWVQWSRDWNHSVT